jgi:hypothetical protein
MIDAGPSLRAAEGLGATELLNYLVANGWSARPSRVDGISILSKRVPDADRAAEFILPVKPGFDEEHRRVADALRTVAKIERRSEEAVADDVRLAFGMTSRPAIVRLRPPSGTKVVGTASGSKVQSVQPHPEVRIDKWDAMVADVELLEIEIHWTFDGQMEARITNVKTREETVLTESAAPIDSPSGSKKLR